LRGCGGRAARRLLVAATLAGVIGLGQFPFPQAMSRSWARPPTGHARVSVIVQVSPGSMPAVERASVALGGLVTRELPIIDGFAVTVPASVRPLLAGLPGVRSVSIDGLARAMAVDPVLGYDPADTGSLSAVSKIVGAQAAWAVGYTGKGVDVAVIDTGVSRVPGLSGAGQVLDGPDLSLDSQNPALTHADSYGHGTFMAGLIAGRDASTVAGYADPSKFAGIAPESRIVNVKVGATDGACDVSQVIAAIDWVVQHAHDPGLNIRVLNLSYGTTSAQPYTIDPLAQAAEQAWKHGIVVVAAAGNDGTDAVELASPAYDPYLLAIGADDPRGSLSTADDKVAKFAQHGTFARPVDVIAPGAHVLGLRVPGSYVDTLTTNTGKVGTRFQRGSGTSQATAITSGIAALTVQRYPTASPDQIKALILNTATLLPKDGSTTLDPKTLAYNGHGIANAALAVKAMLPPAFQAWLPGLGTGTLDATRGGSYLVSNGVALTGQKDIFGQSFNSAAMATLQTQGRSWVGGTWNGRSWVGNDWTSGTWASTTWTGTDWTGRSWVGRSWVGMTWDGVRWYGTGWDGSHWYGAGWTGRSWVSGTWSSNTLD
jgi:serine protease AprX